MLLRKILQLMCWSMLITGIIMLRITKPEGREATLIEGLGTVVSPVTSIIPSNQFWLQLFLMEVPCYSRTNLDSLESVHYKREANYLGLVQSIVMSIVTMNNTYRNPNSSYYSISSETRSNQMKNMKVLEAQTTQLQNMAHTLTSSDSQTLDRLRTFVKNAETLNGLIDNNRCITGSDRSRRKRGVNEHVYHVNNGGNIHQHYYQSPDYRHYNYTLPVYPNVSRPNDHPHTQSDSAHSTGKHRGDNNQPKPQFKPMAPIPQDIVTNNIVDTPYQKSLNNLAWEVADDPYAGTNMEMVEDCKLVKIAYDSCVHVIKELMALRNPIHRVFRDNVESDIPRPNIRSRRQKRGVGLFPFIGTFYKWVIGTADRTEMDALNKLLGETIKEMRTNAEEIRNLGKEMASVSDAVSKELRQIVLKVNKFMTQQIKDSVVNKEQRAQLQTSTDFNTWAQGVSDAISIVFRDMSSDINTNMLFIESLGPHVSTISSLAYHMSVGSYPYEVIGSKILRDSINMIPTLSHNTYVAITPNADDWIGRDNVATIKVLGETVTVSMEIPVKRVIDSYSTYLVSSLPFPINNHWVRLFDDERYVVVEEHTQQYSVVSAHKYHQCLIARDNSCIDDVGWNKLEISDCISNLININAAGFDNCELQAVPEGVAPRIQGLPIKPSSWFISQPIEARPVTIQCGVASGVPGLSTSILPRVSIIKLHPGCSVKVGNTMYKYPSPHIIGEGRAHIYLNGSETHNLTDVLKYNEIHQLSLPQIPKINKTRIRDSKNTTRILDDVLIPIGGASLNEITTKIIEKSSQYATESEKNLAKINQVYTKFQQTETSTWTSGIDWNFWISLISLIISIVSVIFCILRTRNPIIRGTLSSIPLHAMNAGYADAFTIGSPNVSTTTVRSTQTPPVDNKTILEVHENIITIAQSGLSPHLGIIIHLGLMVIVMFLCAHHTKNTIRKILLESLIKLGVYPLNKHVLHNKGETQIIAHFLIAISGIPSSKSCVVEFGVQLATIPGQVQDWRLRDRPNFSEWIVKTSYHWWSKLVDCELNWGPVCIITRFGDTVETCQDMPKRLKLTLGEILGQTAVEIPWVVTHVEIQTLTRLDLVWGTTANCIYNHLTMHV